MTTTATRTGIARESLTLALFAELQPLIVANHAAIGTPSPLVLDSWTIQGMHPLVWVVRSDGRSVGYCAHLVQTIPIHGEKWATCFALYLKREHSPRARALVLQVEQELKAEGVVVITYSVPHGSDAGMFFEAIGYPCLELVMGKRLIP